MAVSFQPTVNILILLPLYPPFSKKAIDELVTKKRILISNTIQ